MPPICKAGRRTCDSDAQECASPDINYLDYVEVVNAIEALGGERPPEREFSGDPCADLSGRCNGLNAHVCP
ncbi:MAG: hypothetical protein ACLUI3_09750 [Christensenellales bacterium]